MSWAYFQCDFGYFNNMTVTFLFKLKETRCSDLNQGSHT